MNTSALTWCIRIGMLLVLVAGCVAWVAVGRLGHVSKAGLHQTDVAMGDAVALADSTAVISQQIQNSLVAVASGMGAASDAIGNTIDVSKNVRRVLDLGSFFGRVDDLSNSLANTEASLAEAQGALSETQQNLVGAEPGVDGAVTVMKELPDQLRTAQQKLHNASGEVDGYVALLRTLIVLLAIVALLMFVVLDRLTGQVARLSAVPDPAIQP